LAVRPRRRARDDEVTFERIQTGGRQATTRRYRASAVPMYFHGYIENAETHEVVWQCAHTHKDEALAKECSKKQLALRRDLEDQQPKHTTLP
jgi:hypothetical protein